MMIQVLEMEIFSYSLSFEMHSVFFDPGEERRRRNPTRQRDDENPRRRKGTQCFLVHHIQSCSFFLFHLLNKPSEVRGDEMRENTKSESRRGSLSSEEIISLSSPRGD